MLFHIFLNFFFKTADVTSKFERFDDLLRVSFSSGKQVFLVLGWPVNVLVPACVEFDYTFKLGIFRSERFWFSL